MAIALSKRVLGIKPSPTLVMTQKAAALRDSGENVISLSAGEPDFDTPDDIRRAGFDAISTGKTRYTAVDGTPDLKEAICEKFRRDNNLHYTPDNISVAPGGKAIIFNAMAATLDPGDEVIIPAPYWVSYPDIVRLFGGTPVIVPTRTETGFRLNAKDLAAAITTRTKWLILNSPNNPTGSVLSTDDLVAIGKVVGEHPSTMVLSDEIYEYILYNDQQFVSFAEANPELFSRTLTMNGVSKGFAMTGWRIGFAAGPVDLIKAMAKVMSQSTSNPCSISQWAATAALSSDRAFLEDWRRAFHERRGLIIDALNRATGLSASPPDGAFYVFADCTALLGRTSPGGRRLKTDIGVAETLLEEERVALVPGTAFGAEGYLRISFATSADQLTEAGHRIARFCQGTIG